LKITASHIAARDDQEYDTGHDKLSARLDLRQPRDLDTLKGLVREGDVFSRVSAGDPRQSRAVARGARKTAPGARLCPLCAFSHKGPWASRRGFDTVVQNVSGITTRQGELFPGASPGPQFYPVSAIDYLTGYLMAAGAMAALARRVQEGGSWGSCVSHWRRPADGWSIAARYPRRRSGTCRRRSHKPTATRRSGGCAIWGPPCSSPKRRPCGLAPRYRSATTSPSGPPAWREPLRPLTRRR
jgi:hypothetical protein